VKTPGATSGPTGTFSEISTDAHCSSGLISGGGISQGIGTGMASNGNHVNGTEPSSDGSSEYQGTAGVVGTDATYWLGIGGSGGMTGAAFSSTPYAMCFSSSLINHTQVVMNKAASTRLLGGGARTTPASDGSMKPIAGYPTKSTYTSQLIAAGDGATDPDSWAAYGYFGDSPETYAYAICSGSGINVSGAHVTVHFKEDSGPTAATSGQTETIGCGSDGNLLSGGAAISAGAVDSTGFALPGSQGDHLNGSYPSNSSGTAAGDGTTAAYWSAATHTGGMSSSNTYSDVWALCGNDGI
jgi:hypothetical protein